MVLVFVGGGVVSMGIRTVEERDKALKHILPAIYACRELKAGSSSRSNPYTRRIEKVAVADSQAHHQSTVEAARSAALNKRKLEEMLRSGAAQRLLHAKKAMIAKPVARQACLAKKHCIVLRRAAVDCFSLQQTEGQRPQEEGQRRGMKRKKSE